MLVPYLKNQTCFAGRCTVGLRDRLLHHNFLMQIAFQLTKTQAKLKCLYGEPCPPIIYSFVSFLRETILIFYQR